MLPVVNYPAISMRNDYYPSGTVRALLVTDLVQDPAKLLLNSRLEKKETVIPVFFDSRSFAMLQAVCKRLIPQPDRIEFIDLAGMLDGQMATDNGNGWRYDKMPPDKEAYISGLNGINESAELTFGKEFPALEESQQDQILSEVQSGNASGRIWRRVPAAFFFEELLASLVELYYSHPIAKEEIGEVAFADAKGWQQIGLNKLEAHEPLATKAVDNQD